jgi:hypothetical protein
MLFRLRIEIIALLADLIRGGDNWKQIVTRQFDPVLKPLGLRRTSLKYYNKSFGNVIATYTSDRLHLWVVRERSRWEIRIIPLQVPTDEEPYELIREYLGEPYSGALSDLPQYIVADYETLCRLFSPQEYPAFKVQFRAWAVERFDRMHPGARIKPS